MSTPAQEEANRPVNRLSHGFNSALLFLNFEKREEFDALLADLTAEFQPATPCEQILLEKMCQNQWLSLRATALQSIVLTAGLITATIHKDLGLLVRYQQSSERNFHKARTELLNAQKERKKSKIGSESQTAQPAPNPVPESPTQTAPQPAPQPAMLPEFISLEAELEAMWNEPDRLLAEFHARRRKATQKAA